MSLRQRDRGLGKLRPGESALEWPSRASAAWMGSAGAAVPTGHALHPVVRRQSGRERQFPCSCLSAGALVRAELQVRHPTPAEPAVADKWAGLGSGVLRWVPANLARVPKTGQ